jgi:hydrogenase maturation protease
MAPRILIIAYGNPLRSDDGVAWHAAQRLREKLTSAQILTVHQLAPELSETAAGVHGVIFLDAAQNGEPGEIVCSQVNPEDAGSQSSHWLTPAQVMALCSQLYGVTPRAMAVSVTGACFDHGDTLSEPIAKALPCLIDRVEALVAQFAD